MTGLLARDVTQEKDLGERRNAFVSIASHELRTPLTSIMGFAEILLKRDLPEALRHDWLERIYQNSVVLSAIVDDMLNLSRIQSGKLALNLEPLSLSAAVNEVLDGIRPGTDKHQFVVDISPDVGQVVADREKLTQILNNLMTNAVKYSPEGGQIKVSARADEDGDLVTVEVADQGMGIAPEHLDQLFSSFARIRRPETEGIKGTGLGLSIVEGLVEMMGGEIWVESELNQGTSLFFSLQTRPIDTEESVVASFRDVGGAYGEKGASG